MNPIQAWRRDHDRLQHARSLTIKTASKRLVGKNVRLLHDIETKGGTRFSAGEIVTIQSAWRGTFYLVHEDRRSVSRIRPWEVELVDELPPPEKRIRRPPQGVPRRLMLFGELTFDAQYRPFAGIADVVAQWLPYRGKTVRVTLTVVD